MPQHDKQLPVGAEFETFHSHLSSISIRTHASNTQCSASGLSSNYYPVQMLLNISDLFESDCDSVIGSQAEQVVRISLHHERRINISSRSDCQLKLWSWNSIDRKETEEKKRVAVEWKKDDEKGFECRPWKNPRFGGQCQPILLSCLKRFFPILGLFFSHLAHIHIQAELQSILQGKIRGVAPL